MRSTGSDDADRVPSISPRRTTGVRDRVLILGPPTNAHNVTTTTTTGAAEKHVQQSPRLQVHVRGMPDAQECRRDRDHGHRALRLHAGRRALPSLPQPVSVRVPPGQDAPMSALYVQDRHRSGPGRSPCGTKKGVMTMQLQPGAEVYLTELRRFGHVVAVVAAGFLPDAQRLCEAIDAQGLVLDKQRIQAISEPLTETTYIVLYGELRTILGTLTTQVAVLERVLVADIQLMQPGTIAVLREWSAHCEECELCPDRVTRCATGATLWPGNRLRPATPMPSAITMDAHRWVEAHAETCDQCVPHPSEALKWKLCDDALTRLVTGGEATTTHLRTKAAHVKRWFDAAKEHRATCVQCRTHRGKPGMLCNKGRYIHEQRFCSCKADTSTTGRLAQRDTLYDAYAEHVAYKRAKAYRRVHYASYSAITVDRNPTSHTDKP